MERLPLCLLGLVFYLHCSSSLLSVHSNPDYLTALRNSILFFEGQRSGRLPSTQRLNWRWHSALRDGFSEGVDLVGGYYDAGDNVKFGLPMAFTITMLSWSVIEYGRHISTAGEIGHARQAIKWGTDYFIKAHTQPNLLWGEVGDGDSDHYCWQRPEEMTTSRKAYSISESRPGSDLAGETAAAMAAASIVFRHTQPAYSRTLVEHAKQLFNFANTYRGRYDSSITVARNYYLSASGYNDELLWAALWLYQATLDNYYLNYAVENAHSLGGIGWSMTEFSWDVKYAGLQVLASKILMKGRAPHADVLRQYQSKAEYFMCACLKKNYGKNVARTPGGLLYTRSWNNMQYVSSATFLMTVYSDYISKSNHQIQCQAGRVTASDLFSMAKSQVDYILGNNPRGTSYMVGYGSNYPKRIHHRAASIVSYKVDKTFVECRKGYQTWYSSKYSDPNLMVGAIVGGPDENDNYADDRKNFEQSEPTTYNNGPMVGVLARMYGASIYGRRSASEESISYKEDGTVVNKSAISITDNYSDQLIIVQELNSSWTEYFQKYNKYQVTVKNISPRTLKSLELMLANLNGPIWGLSKNGPNTYTFPTWLQNLPSQQSFEFVYIHPGPQAFINIASAIFT